MCMLCELQGGEKIIRAASQMRKASRQRIRTECYDCFSVGGIVDEFPSVMEAAEPGVPRAEARGRR
jgi:hypothetical protein